MKRIIWILLLTVVFCFPLNIFAKGGAGNGNSNQPELAGVTGQGGVREGGNDSPGVNKGEDYGDLWIVYRDENGEPIFDNNGCVQPIDAEGNLITMVFIEGKCELLETNIDDVQEVDIGRLNSARSPDEVLQASYDEALSALNNAISIGLDGAGRLTVMIFSENTGEVVEKRIDSPLENLALYKALMLNGYLPDLEKTFDALGPLAHLQMGYDGTVDNPLSQADFLQAAAFLGGSADKAGEISLDLLITLNSFLGLNPKENRSNVEYYDFSSFDYSGDLRTATFAGRTEYLLVVENPDAPLIEAKFHVENLSIANITFFDLLDPYRENLFLIDGQTHYLYFDIGGAWKFAQAADDVLKAINFIHNFEVPQY